jgi:hypothetical protein
VLKGIKSKRICIECLSEKLWEASAKEKVETLTAIPGIGIAIASAVLTVLCPDDFTLIDDRVIASLKTLTELGIQTNGATDDVGTYLAYVAQCKVKAKANGMTLRDFDRALWGKDFYEGKDGLKALASPG